MVRRTGKVQDCGPGQARERLAEAREFLEAAELYAEEHSAPAPTIKVAASNAVLAGIAAADAACCKVLGTRNRSEDHRDALKLLRQIEPGGGAAARNLQRLLDGKDQAFYGLSRMSGQGLRPLTRNARHLIEFAENL